jgi:hypothetical protein
MKPKEQMQLEQIKASMGKLYVLHPSRRIRRKHSYGPLEVPAFLRKENYHGSTE